LYNGAGTSNIFVPFHLRLFFLGYSFAVGGATLEDTRASHQLGKHRPFYTVILDGLADMEVTFPAISLVLQLPQRKIFAMMLSYCLQILVFG
jgi:hypothetical protein